MKKIVVNLGIDAVAGVQGVDSVAVDMEKNQITVIGGVDPLVLSSKLRKFGFTEWESEEKIERIVFVPCCTPSEYTVVVTEDNLINSCGQPSNGCTIC